MPLKKWFLEENLGLIISLWYLKNQLKITSLYLLTHTNFLCFLFLSARERKPRASSDRFCLLPCLLSLSQISLYQHLHTHKPPPAHQFKSERIPKRILKRIPKKFQKKIPKEFQKEFQKNSKNNSHKNSQKK